MALHEQSVGATDEWYTPPYIFEALDCKFSVDVASPGAAITPWIPATRFVKTRSLERDWTDWGFVWMNPPFGGRNGIEPWLAKFFAHGNGVALVPDRTSAPWFQKWAPRARLVLFVSPKIKFIGGNGQANHSPAQGTALLAAGIDGAVALDRANKLGVIFRPCE